MLHRNTPTGREASTAPWENAMLQHHTFTHRLDALLCTAFWCLALAGAAGAQQILPRLPALGLRADAVTVSGLSSGGYMAGQFAVAYSASVSGVAVLAAGPYGCSRGSVGTAMLNCSCPAEPPFALRLQAVWAGGCQAFNPDVYGVFSDAATLGNRDGIDDTRHLKRQRVWLFSGGRDAVVEAPLVQAVQAYYRRHGTPEAQVFHERRPDAGHGFPSPEAQQACGVTHTPFITQCQLDAAGELLKWLHPGLAAVQAGATKPGSFKRFKQARYGQPQVFDGLDSSGWLYVPAACEQAGASCRLHVAFHGCEQGQGFATAGGKVYGAQFVKGTGYNRWAEAGGIVVLYPQVKASSQGGLFDPYRFNPKGCWDFWGYTEKFAAANPGAPDFAKRSAPQMRAIKAMVDDLSRQP